MSKFKRRFKKEEFEKEIFTHLKDMPPQYLHKHEKLEEIARWKSEHYEKVLEALDAAKDRVKRIADTHQDGAAKQEAELAVKEIDDAIETYGEASLSGNSVWEPYHYDH